MARGLCGSRAWPRGADHPSPRSGVTSTPMSASPRGSSSDKQPLTFTYSISIIASPSRVLWAFFDPGALSSWWQAARSVTVPRLLGAYAIEWDPTEFRDEVLGR